MQEHRTHLSHPRYRPDIDGLRAIAVLAVVAFHAFPAWIGGGFIGVDVFFVISGYLISTIVFENLDARTFRFSAFYARRIRRLFPALIFVLVACFIFGWFVLLADEYKQLGKRLVACAAFISNIVFWNEAGYFDTSADTKPLLHLWSLGIEEQFYIFWPPLLWIASKSRINFLVINVAIALVSFCLNIKGIKQDAVATFYSPQTRFWELSSGSLLAWVHLYKKAAVVQFRNKIDTLFSRFIKSKNKEHASEAFNILSLVGLSLLIYGFWRVSEKLRFPGAWALIPVFGAVSIIMAGPEAWLNRKILSNRILVWFGLISFPLYLWHWPLLSFARIIESEVPSLDIRVAAVVFSIALAWFTYKFVERPFRSGKRQNTKVAILVVVMTVVGFVGYSTFLRDGLPYRHSLSSLPPPIERLAEDVPASHKSCLGYYGISEKAGIRYCRLSVYDHQKPHVALIGDSHAASLYAGLSDQLIKNHEGLLLLGGRLFIDVATYPEGIPSEIVAYQGGIFATEFVARQTEIETVIMVSRGPGYINSVNPYYLLSDPAIKDRKVVFETGMRKTLDLLIANKKKIVFVLDNPDDIGFDPERCQDRRLFKTAKAFDCSIPRARFDARQKDYRELVLRTLKDYPTVTLFDQAAYLCNQSSCFFKDGSTVLYGDDHHLSVGGANMMAKELAGVLNGASARILNQPSL